MTYKPVSIRVWQIVELDETKHSNGQKVADPTAMVEIKGRHDLVCSGNRYCGRSRVGWRKGKVLFYTARSGSILPMLILMVSLVKVLGSMLNR